MEISWNDFEKIEMRIGTILKVKDFPEARNASYQLYIDFGAVIGVKKTINITLIVLIFCKSSLDLTESTFALNNELILSKSLIG